MSDDTKLFFERDLPVLKAIVKLHDEEGGWVTIIQVVQATGLAADDVSRAARRLQADHLIDGNTLADGSFQNFHTVTGRGLRMADAWPTPENVADRMIAVLEEIAANTSDEDTRSRVKKILDALKGPSKAIIITSIAKIFTEGMA